MTMKLKLQTSPHLLLIQKASLVKSTIDVPPTSVGRGNTTMYVQAVWLLLAVYISSSAPSIRASGESQSTCEIRRHGE